MSERGSVGGARKWTTWLWAAVFSALAVGTDMASQGIQRRAADRALLLLPKDKLDEPRRNAVLNDLKNPPEIASARWISPNVLAQETAQLLPRDRWSELFSEEEAWLPWVAELQFRNPVFSPSAANDRVRSLRSDPTWRLALWDDEALERDVFLLRKIYILAAVGGGLILILGFNALRLTPRPEAGPWREAAVNALVAPAMIAGLGLIALSVGVELLLRSWLIGVGTSFALAGVLAPMIKTRSSTRQSAAQKNGGPSEGEKHESQ